MNYKKRKKYRRTYGDDMDILREKENRRSSSKACSDDYKNHIDGA